MRLNCVGFCVGFSIGGSSFEVGGVTCEFSFVGVFSSCCGIVGCICFGSVNVGVGSDGGFCVVSGLVFVGVGNVVLGAGRIGTGCGAGSGVGEGVATGAGVEAGAGVGEGVGCGSGIIGGAATLPTEIDGAGK